MTSLKRHFRVVINSKEHGLYVSSTPSSAARKAVSKLLTHNKNKKFEFYIRETTQGSQKKTYGPYLGYMEKLDKPVELEGRVIKYKPIAKLNKKNRKMKGGNGTINGQKDNIYKAYYNLIVEEMNEYCINTPFDWEEQWEQTGVNNRESIGKKEVNTPFKSINKHVIILKLKKQFGLEEIKKLMEESSEMKEVEKKISIYIKTFGGQTTKYDKRPCNNIFEKYFPTDNIYITKSNLYGTIEDAELIKIGFTPQTYIKLKSSVRFKVDIPVEDFIKAGYTLDKLVDDGVPEYDIEQVVKKDDLINGLSLKNLKKFNIDLKDIISKKQYSIKELLDAGYSIKELLDAGFDKKYISEKLSEKLLDLFESGKIKYGDIKKKINEIKESIISSSNEKNQDFFKSIEDRLNELKKNVLRNFITANFAPTQNVYIQINYQ